MRPIALKLVDFAPIPLTGHMQQHDLHLTRLALLVALALGLGMVLLQLDLERIDGLATAATTPGSQPAPAVAPTPAAAGANDGALAADRGTSGAPQPDASAAGGGGQPSPATAPPQGGDQAAQAVVRRRGGIDCATPHLLVDVPRDVAIHATPAGRRIHTMPARSKYLGQPVIAWVQAVSDDGAWGKVTLPWSKPVGRAGWIRIAGLQRRTTTTLAVADLSERRLVVYRRCRAIESVRTAIGRPGSPSPTGRFWVSDRVVVPAAQRGSFGSFAFGLSTVQPNLPAGWTGGDQMAVHGTGAPGSIGEAASAGCLRVGEDALARLKPLLLLGTPLVITA